MTQHIPLTLQVGTVSVVLGILAAIMGRGGSVLWFWLLAAMCWFLFMLEETEE